jgi:2-methylisocitrate lyase-like PEP mutase family enzyme
MLKRRETLHKYHPGAHLRELLTAERPLPTIWGGTAHHAQLAEAVGFKAFGLSGSNTSTQLLGLPDAGLLTMTELVDNVRRVCNATRLPVIVDCDTGFGNAVNVVRTVDEVVRAGAAALFLEDQVSPKRCGFVKGKEVIALDEAVGKFRAACEHRDELDPSFVIIGRTDVRGAAGGSLDAVVERGKAYLEAGIDIFYAEALQTREEIRYVRAALPDCLLMVIPYSMKPPLSRQEIADLGLCLASVHIARIGATAMYDFLIDYRERGEDAWNQFSTEKEQHPLGGFGIFDLTGFPEILDLERRYLPKERLDRYDDSIGVYDPRSRKT